MFVRSESSEGEVQLKVSGPLNNQAAEEFQKELAELAAGDYKTIILDLREVPSINSTSLGKILLLRKTLTEEDRTIRINGCSEALYNTFQLINFDRLISIDR
jgi:anti-anti-sigma factor